MISDLSYLLRARGWSMLGMLGLSVLVAFLLTAVDPVAMKLLIDVGLGQRNGRVFVLVIGCVVAMAVVASGINLLQGLWTRKIKNALTAALCERLFLQYFQLPYELICRDGSASFVSRAYEEPRKAIELAVDLLQRMLGFVVTIVTALGISVYLSWRVTLILALIVPVLYMISRRFGTRIRSQSRVEGEREAALRNRLSRGLQAYVTVNSFSLQHRVAASLDEGYASFFQVLYQRTRSTMVFRTVSGLSMAFAESAVMAVAAVDVFLGHLSVGGMLAFMAGFWKLMGGVNGLVANATDFSRVSGYVDRLRDFEAMALPASDEAGDCAIRLRDVDFRYGDRYVLREVNFELREGESVALVGANGAGKTTLGLLLCGYLRASRIDDRSLLPGRRDVSAMLSPLLFYQASLLEHLNWDDLTPARREQAEAMLGDFGLLGRLDDDPESFSEGEKRKAYVAMCLLRDAHLYLFDEPLSAVDEDSKKCVIEWIVRLCRGRRLLVIMHGDTQFHRHFDRVERLAAGGFAVPEAAVT